MNKNMNIDMFMDLLKKKRNNMAVVTNAIGAALVFGLIPWSCSNVQKISLNYKIGECYSSNLNHFESNNLTVKITNLDNERIQYVYKDSEGWLDEKPSYFQEEDISSFNRVFKNKIECPKSNKCEFKPGTKKCENP